MRISKPLKIMRSLLVLFVGVGLLSMSLQMIVMERLHNESLGYYQNALIDSRFYETTSFAKLVRNDMDTFGTQIYMLYSGMAGFLLPCRTKKRMPPPNGILSLAFGVEGKERCCVPTPRPWKISLSIWYFP